MKKPKSEISLKEAIRLHWWAIKLWWGVKPKLFLSTILYSLTQTLTPYVTIWLSAQLINEIAGERRSEILWRWVMLTIAVTAICGLLTAALYHWKQAVHGDEWFLGARVQSLKTFEMDYVDVESKQFRDLCYQMLQHTMGNVGGFSAVHSYFLEDFINGVASILGAVMLTVSLFSQRVPSGALTVLNHPLCTVAVILLLLGGVALSPVIEARGSQVISQLWPYQNKANRVYSVYATLNESYRALDVRMYRQHEIARDAILSNSAYRKGSPAIGIIRKYARYLSASQVVSVVLTGTVYIFVCLKAWAGAFGIGSVTQYVSAITQLCAGLANLLAMVGRLPFNAKYLKDMHSYLTIPNTMYQGSLPTEKRSDREYDVEFRDVSFQYPGTDRYVLRHVNMRFKVGSRLAVVGRNGSGKTTFIKLLCRLYDPTEGQILLNGIDIRKYQYDDYRDLFSVVFQEFHLQPLPLGQNVAVAADYDRAKAEDCLRKAGFGERLDKMPKGLDTYLYKTLEKEGVDVSGGEAQKIAIARALYRDAPFIVLDEPTAALDPIAEAEIYSKFNEIAGDKTAIYISHRLSSCQFCDEILVFHEGAVVQQGTHDALLADENGKYFALWHAQAQYYTEKDA